jgi:hypothetical protein
MKRGARRADERERRLQKIGFHFEPRNLLGFCSVSAKRGFDPVAAFA